MKHLFYLLFVIYINLLYAQNSTEEDINASRPNQSAPSQPIPQGTVQIETGVLFEHERIDKHTTNQWLYPTTMVRFGLLKPLEINLFHEFIRIHEKIENEDQPPFTASDNLVIGTVIKLAKARGRFPRIGLSVNLTVPSGSKTFRVHHLLPEALLAFSHQISDKFRFRYTAGWQADDEQSRGNGIYVVGTGYDLSDKLNFFAEVYGEVENMNAFILKANGGLTYLLTKNCQLDIAGGTGITMNYYFITSGFSIRLPH